MQRYFLYCSYKGSNYHGWQVQPNGISVQEKLTHCLQTVLRCKQLETVGAGRTDAGVHAEEMVVHFDLEDRLAETDTLVEKLNAFLPPDIAVSKILRVKSDAHARFDALLRRYEYRVTTRKDVFGNEAKLRVKPTIDFEKMNEAAQLLLQVEDFTSFSRLHTDVKTNNCRVSRACWEARGTYDWSFSIEADRFLRNMVRAIVGTLLEVGKGRMSLLDFQQVIEARDRSRAASSAPAKALFLMEVQYPASIFETEL